MKTNLTTGVVDFVLINNWNSTGSPVVGKPAIGSGDEEAEEIITLKPFSNGGYTELEVISTDTFMTKVPALPHTFTEAGTFKTTYPLTSDYTKSEVVAVKKYEGDGTLVSTTYLTYTKATSLSRLNTEAGLNITDETGAYILI